MQDRALWRPGRTFELDVVGVGENSLDQVCVVDRLLSAGEKLDLDRSLEVPGGQIATAMLGCQRLGLRAGYVGAVGDDPAAARILEPLERTGVDLGGVVRIPHTPSRTAVVLVHRETGDRAIFGSRDPRLALRPGDLHRDSVVRGAVLQIDARDPDLSCWAAREARKQGIPVVLDADRWWRTADELLRLVDFPLVARSFAEECGGTGSVRDGLRALASGGARLAVVTLGEQGAIAAHGEDVFETPAFAVRVRDTTGAGDAFHAGFIWGLHQGLGARGALRAAHAVAAMNCEALGAQAGLPGREELERFLSARASEVDAGEDERDARRR